jgi:hypothetical protein
VITIIITMDCEIIKNFNESEKENLKNIITRLKFIGMVNKGEKINVKELVTQENTFLTSIFRMFSCDSKEKTLEFLDSTIREAIKMIVLLNGSKSSYDTGICETIIKDIEGSIKGLENIQNTYSSKKIVVCSVQTLIDLIRIELANL